VDLPPRSLISFQPSEVWSPIHQVHPLESCPHKQFPLHREAVFRRLSAQKHTPKGLGENPSCHPPVTFTARVGHRRPLSPILGRHPMGGRRHITGLNHVRDQKHTRRPLGGNYPNRGGYQPTDRAARKIPQEGGPPNRGRGDPYGEEAVFLLLPPLPDAATDSHHRTTSPAPTTLNTIRTPTTQPQQARTSAQQGPPRQPQPRPTATAPLPASTAPTKHARASDSTTSGTLRPAPASQRKQPPPR